MKSYAMPKMMIVWFVMLCVMTGYSSTTQEVKSSQLKERAGLVYDGDSKEPYTGRAFDTYTSGKKKSEMAYKDGKPDGTMTAWYESGEKLGEVNYKDGLPDGKTIAWHPNGKKQAEMTFKDGKPVGTGMTWYSNGAKETETTYKDGMKNGKAMMWYESGEVKVVMYYVDDKDDGISTIFYKSGQKKSELTIKDGQTEGTATYWYENGKKKQLSVFKDGKEISVKLWDEDGKIKPLAPAEKEKHELRMSLNDSFIVEETDDWSVDVQKQLRLRFAEVNILPRMGHEFNMQLSFFCDTPDLAQFDSSEKIKNEILTSSKVYLPNTVEKKIEVKKISVKGSYGWYTVLTDAEVAGKTKIPAGEFKYITRGMIRLSPDSALGFSVMTNEINTPAHKKLLKYICSFIKEKEKQQKTK